MTVRELAAQLGIGCQRRIQLPGIGALVLDALTTGRFAEARAIASERGSRVTIDRAPRDYLLVLWSDGIPEPDRCESFHWQYRCTKILRHVGEHHVLTDNGNEYTWPRDPSRAPGRLNPVPLGVSTFAITDVVPNHSNVVLERDGAAARFEIVNAGGNVVHSGEITGAHGGSAGMIVSIEIAQRLRAAARELRYTLDDIERRSSARADPMRMPFGRPQAVCGCLAGAPCALHRAYW